VPFFFYTGYRVGGLLDEFPNASVLLKPATKQQFLDCLAGVLKNDNFKRQRGGTDASLKF
jgi:hypothetical protein